MTVEFIDDDEFRKDPPNLPSERIVDFNPPSLSVPLSRAIKNCEYLEPFDCISTTPEIFVSLALKVMVDMESTPKIPPPNFTSPLTFIVVGRRQSLSEKLKATSPYALYEPPP